jgi:glycosyltransferase involved in cell wall biosynthesis
MTSAAPVVSVLMAVHNGAPWVREAVDSVLGQTLSDLELIVIDDASTDATPTLLASIRDVRLRVERSSVRRGLSASLAEAWTIARAPLIARLDADDVSETDRLARQQAFLSSHPEIGLLGGAAREVDAAGRPLALVTPPLDDAALRRALIRENPFVHSTVMMRRSAADAAGGYDARRKVAQDYDLWMRMSRVTRLANLPDVLVVRRRLPGAIGVARDDERLRTEIAVRWRALCAGRYPLWTVVFVIRPALALLLPRRLRSAVRGLRPGQTPQRSGVR